MRTLLLFSFMLALLTSYQSWATTSPTISSATLIRSDTTTNPVVLTTALPVTEQKLGFFQKLKIKVVGFILGEKQKGEDKKSTKRALAWVSIVLLVLGLGLALLLNAAALLWLVPAGFLLGIVSLFIKGDAKQKKENKQGRTVALITLGIVVGLLTLLLVSMSGRRH